MYQILHLSPLDVRSAVWHKNFGFMSHGRCFFVVYLSELSYYLRLTPISQPSNFPTETYSYIAMHSGTAGTFRTVLGASRPTTVNDGSQWLQVSSCGRFGLNIRWACYIRLTSLLYLQNIFTG